MTDERAAKLMDAMAREEADDRGDPAAEILIEAAAHAASAIRSKTAWMERAQRAEAELAGRDAVRDAFRAESMCAYGCPSPSFHEAAVAGGWDGVTQRAFDACLQKTWKEHVRTCPNHPQRKVESCLKEALGALRQCVRPAVSDQQPTRDRAEAILARARQEGFTHD